MTSRQLHRHRTARFCPNGHVCRPATAPSCMVGTGYFYCGECESEPRYRAMSGRWARGMYWPLERTTEAIDV